MEHMNTERMTFTQKQHLSAIPSKVFPLLCPVEEYKWIPGWNGKMVYTDSGVAEDNCIFTTLTAGSGNTETWVVSQYEKDRTIQFIRFNETYVIRYNIFLEVNDDGTTTALWEQIYTALNDEGNKYVKNLKDEAFITRISRLEKLLNYYLTTGIMLEMK